MMSERSRSISLSSLVALLLAVLSSGCALFNTSKKHYAGMEEDLRAGNFSAPLARVEAQKEKAYKQKDRVVYYLDAGMLHHWNGNYQQSNKRLEQAERAIEENVTKSLTRSASALLLNDNIQAYAGEDYEDVYLNAFKALNYLALKQNDEAFVEVRRINHKLAQLDRKHAKTADKLNQAEEALETFKLGKNHFVDSALGRYLSLLLYRNEGKWDDVRIDLEKIAHGWKCQPEIYPFPIPDFSAEQERVTASQARLNLIVFSGVAPDKSAQTFYIHTEEDLIILGHSQENYLGGQVLDNLGVIPWPGINAGYHFKFQLPSLKRRPSRVSRIEVVVDNTTTVSLQRIESLEKAALETFKIKKPMLYLRSLTRSIAKGLAAEQAKHQMTQNMDDSLAFFTRIITDVAVDTTENADLRISRFFPAEAYIKELHLPEGSHNLKIHYYSSSGALLYTDYHPEVTLRAHRLNIVQSAYLN